MNDTSVTADQAPDHFAEIAAELHRAANDVATLIGSGLPKPSQFALNIQPGGPLSQRTDDVTAAAVDAMSGALLGIPGRLQKMSDGSYHYATEQTRRGPIQVQIYQSVSTEWALKREAAAKLAEREAELAKLRAEVAELRAAAAPTTPAGSGPLTSNGFDYTRADTDADDPTPVSPARVPLHTGGSISGIADDGHRVGEPSAPIAEHCHVGGSVGGFGENSAECACGTTFDGFDTPAEATKLLDLHIEAATSPTGLTRAADESRGALAGTTPVVAYFSFGHGQTDPDTGESLLDHYATVVAPTYEACREAMFASRFGRAWSFDYLAGTARATEWIPRWTEHEVIVAPGITQAEAEDALIAAWNVLDVAASAE